MFFGNTLNFVAAVGGLCTFCCFGNSIEEKYLQNIPRGNFHEKCKNSTTSLFRYWLQLFGKHKLVTNALFKQARKSDKSLMFSVTSCSRSDVCYGDWIMVSRQELQKRANPICCGPIYRGPICCGPIYRGLICQWPNLTGHTKALLNKFKLELTKRHEMAISPVLQKLNHMKLKSVLFWPKCCIRGVFWGAPKFPICWVYLSFMHNI